jgi:hypothetical protein
MILISCCCEVCILLRVQRESFCFWILLSEALFLFSERFTCSVLGAFTAILFEDM